MISARLNFYLLLIVVICLGLGSWGRKLSHKVAVAGSSGYIGRQVVKELIKRDIPTIALVRSTNLPAKTLECLQGAELVLCNVMNGEEVQNMYNLYKPTSTICCLASRSGVKKDAWAVDYQAGLHVLRAQESIEAEQKHFVLLSAFCCGKPLLQFQFAKLMLEEQIMQSKKLSYSIVRPTAFFKSVDGQVESIQKGFPALYFGDGSTSANAISESDLANFMIDCITKSSDIGMKNAVRNVGGPDVPPLTKKQQLGLVYDTLNIRPSERKMISIPVALLDSLISSSSFFENVCKSLGWESGEGKCGDVAEIARIVRYYATEDMVAIGAGEVQGSKRLADHFDYIRDRGGNLEEVDKMTTTTGVLELLVRNDYPQ